MMDLPVLIVLKGAISLLLQIRMKKKSNCIYFYNICNASTNLVLSRIWMSVVEFLKTELTVLCYENTFLFTCSWLNIMFQAFFLKFYIVVNKKNIGCSVCHILTLYFLCRIWKICKYKQKQGLDFFVQNKNNISSLSRL